MWILQACNILYQCDTKTVNHSIQSLMLNITEQLCMCRGLRGGGCLHKERECPQWWSRCEHHILWSFGHIKRLDSLEKFVLEGISTKDKIMRQEETEMGRQNLRKRLGCTSIRGWAGRLAQSRELLTDACLHELVATHSIIGICWSK